MAEIQIENSVSHSKYQWSGEALEKELLEVGEVNKKIVMVYFLTKQENENPSPITFKLISVTFPNQPNLPCPNCRIVLEPTSPSGRPQ